MALGLRVKEVREEMRMSQEELANRVGDGLSQAAISNMETRDGESSRSSRRLAEVLGVHLKWLETGRGPKYLSPPAEAARAGVLGEPNAFNLQPIRAWEHEDDLPPGDYVFIPRLDVHLSAGNGHEQIELDLIKERPQAFRAEWIRSRRLKPSKLASMTASGDSMEPTIYSGDALVIDTSQNEIKDGGVFALWYDGGERVKRLSRRPGGGVVIHSDNSNKYPDIQLSMTEAEHIRIIGRVVHKAGDGGL